MEPQAPVGGHVRTTDHLLVLLDNCFRLGAKEEVKIQDPPNDPVAEARGGQRDVHPIAVPQVHTVGEGGGGGGGGRADLEVEWVRAIWSGRKRGMDQWRRGEGRRKGCGQEGEGVWSDHSQRLGPTGVPASTLNRVSI